MTKQTLKRPPAASQGLGTVYGEHHDGDQQHSPISKNSGMLTIRRAAPSSQGSAASLPRSRLSTTLSAPPECASRLPGIASSTISTPT